MRDFSSAHYLGMRHSSRELPDWEQLGSGIPAALDDEQEAALAKNIAQRVAAMQGVEAGVVAPSTLHLFYDLYGYLATQQVALFMDEKIYTVARYGVEQAQLRSVPIIQFRHQDVADLERKLRQHSSARTPIILSDGWCPQCARAAPLQHYLRLVQSYNGWIVVDDTQSLGILGWSPNKAQPYGYDGGGLLPHVGIRHAQIISIASLAKGFAVPLACLSSSSSFIQQFKKYSKTRVHSSPPSFAVLHGAAHALERNRREGNALRQQLLHRVRYMKSRLAKSNIYTVGGDFPVQSFSCADSRELTLLQHYLRECGIRSIGVAPHRNTRPALCCIIRATHSIQDIDALTDALIEYHAKDCTVQQASSSLSQQSYYYQGLYENFA